MRLRDVRQIQDAMKIDEEFVFNPGEYKIMRENKVDPIGRQMFIFFEKRHELDPEENNLERSTFLVMYCDQSGSVKTEHEFDQNDW